MTDEREPDRAAQASELIGLNQELRRAIQSGLRPEQLATDVRGSESLAQNLAAMAELQRAMWRDGIARMEATYRRNLPENWQEIDSSLVDVIGAVKESGISLVWAPRSELVLRFVAATSGAEREDLLAAERDTVVADLDAAMQAVGTVELAGFGAASAFALDAIAAAHDGHMTAAQALAACGLEPAAKLSFGITSLAKVRKEFETRNVDDVGATLLKVTLLQMCTHKALAQFHPGDPLPEGFNRHATQHGVRTCFSDANALAGVLLLVGWLREFRWFADHHAEMFRPAA